MRLFLSTFILFSVLFGQVDYNTEIQTIFNNSCTSCHLYGSNNGLNLTNYSATMTGGINGLVIEAGDHANSELYNRITLPETANGDMPPTGSLSQSDIDLIAQWIDEGALEVPVNADCYADDGTEGVELWGECYSIENTTELNLEGTGLTDSIPPEIGNLVNLNYLNLFNNSLTGSIPSEIGDLTNLTILSLGRNQLTSIPPEIGNLINLNELILNFNQLTGEIPFEIFDLVNLYKLILFGNQLTGSIPSEIGNLTNLGYIWLWGNDLTGSLPPEIGNLTNLHTLSLSSNQFTGQIPWEIGNLTNLTSLGLSNNQLTGVPESICDLTIDWMMEFSIDQNQICPPYPSCIEDYMGNQDTTETGCTPCDSYDPNYVELWYECYSIENITELNLSNSGLSGTIPADIGGLTNLTSLNLSDNQLTGEIPADIWGLTNLTSLNLSGNQLTGEIPAEIDSLTVLNYLYLNNNLLSGEFPEPICNLPIDFSNDFTITENQICPPYPSCIEGYMGNQDTAECTPCQLSVEGYVELWDECYLIENTTALNLEDSGLTGEIPSEIGNLINLINLEIGGNQLTGDIPPEMGDLINLVDVNMGGNQLTGSIPPELENLANLLYFYAGNNELAGSIPPELGNLTNLEGLWLYNNQLTGSIPPELGNMTNMNELNLNNNQLMGSIPPELGNLVNLGSFEARNNELTGSIPPELMNSLGYLNISNNQLSGVIPESICNLVPNGGNWESYVSISNNQLCPFYPECLSNELYLEQDISNCELELWGEYYLNGTTTELDLSNSGLSDSIPSAIGYLTNLTNLNLENNQLIGSIPSEIGYLTNLDTLNLADNQLSGVIPESICNLYSNLNSFSIDNNQLCPIYPGCLNYYDFGSQDISGCPEWECNEGEVELWYECYSIEYTDGDLYLDSTGLTGSIPPEIGNLTNLRYLYLNGNNLTGEIPPEISNMADLRRLNLEDNQLTGMIPSEIGDIPHNSFRYLFLKNNQFSGVSENICNLNIYWQSDSRFSISGNQICWSWPNCIEDYMGEQDISDCTPCQQGVEGYVWLWDECYSIENTTSLNLENSGLSDSIPSEIGYLTNLTNLNLKNNQLIGTIPSEIGNLTNLDTLNLSDNQLTGEISESICNIYPNLNSFSIANNQLCPPLPECLDYNDFVSQDISNCTEWGCNEGEVELWFECYSIDNTTSLNLSNSGLSGTIPTDIGDLTNLTILNLNDNQLTGEIPQLGDLSNLDSLNLGHNQLSGEIPQDISNLTDLYTLDLSNNELSGEIPPEFGISWHFWRIETIDLSHNQLTGEIPDTLSAPSYLKYLYLNNNQFVGGIPSSIHISMALIEIDLSHNQLSGEISYLPYNNLIELDLSHNQLSGEIPSNLPGLLENINLSNNQLSGEIPTLPDLQQLSILDLENNQLSGTLNSNSFFAYHYNLSNLYLANNQLSGEIYGGYMGICSLSVDFSDSTAFSITENQFCPPYPSCLEPYMEIQYCFPTIEEISDTTIDEDSNLLVTLFAESAEGNSITLSAITDTLDVIASINNQLLTVSPASDWNGNSLISVIVTDENNLSDTTGFNLTILPVNDPPSDFSLLSPENETVINITPDNINDTLWFECTLALDIEDNSLDYQFDFSSDLIFLDTIINSSYSWVDAMEVADPNLKWIKYSSLAGAIYPLDIVTGDWMVTVADSNYLVNALNGPFSLTINTTSLDIIQTSLIPVKFTLHQNYPNPFNPTTEIRYDLPSNEYVSINIYDVMGRKIKSLISINQEAGYRSITWDATNDLGQSVSAGMYIYTIQAGEFRQTKKMVLLK